MVNTPSRQIRILLVSVDKTIRGDVLEIENTVFHDSRLVKWLTHNETFDNCPIKLGSSQSRPRIFLISLQRVKNSFRPLHRGCLRVYVRCLRDMSACCIEKIMQCFGILDLANRHSNDWRSACQAKLGEINIVMQFTLNEVDRFASVVRNHR